MRRDARYKKQFGADLEEAYFNLIQLYQDTENNPDDKDLKELYQDLPLSVKVLLTGKGTGEGHIPHERLGAGWRGKLEDLHDYGSDEIYPSSAQLGPTFKDFRFGPPRLQQRKLGQPSKDWRSHRDKSFRRKRGRL
jgi:hypothetical protein